MAKRTPEPEGADCNTRQNIRGEQGRLMRKDEPAALPSEMLCRSFHAHNGRHDPTLNDEGCLDNPGYPSCCFKMSDVVLHHPEQEWG